MELSEVEFNAIWSLRSNDGKSDYDIVTSHITDTEREYILCWREAMNMYGVQWAELCPKQKEAVVTKVYRKLLST